MMMVHAVRTDIRSIFNNYPIQSDYKSIYDTKVNNASDQHVITSLNPLLKETAQKIVDLLPLKYKNFIYGIHQLWINSFSNKGFYKRWYPF